ncbi:hypothetical protein [Conexibacter woesei]|uniref:hypothetical protein n=1 Tax=Conexibacter woesei TaxID=191495 RepID=UPI0003FAB4C4|nr:hypothetical protein [Conexibacter woesei]
MATLSLHRHKTKKQRAATAASRASSAAWTFLKARIAWAAGKRATKVAVPAAAVGTAAIVARRHSSHSDTPPAPPTSNNGTPKVPAGVS